MTAFPVDITPAASRVTAWRVWGWAACLGCLALLAGGGSAWWWAGTDGSLAWASTVAARWAPASWVPEMREVTGSLRHGGRIGELRWQQATPSETRLTVHATGVEFRWQPHALWRGALQIDALSAQSVQITWPASQVSASPPEALTLPLDVRAAFAVQRLTVHGAVQVAMTGIQGDYAYDNSLPQPAGHHFKLSHVTLAQGDYTLDARLQAQAPMAVQASLSGQVRAQLPTAAPGAASARMPAEPWMLHAQAHAEGTLSGTGAALTVTAQLRAPAPGARPVAGPELALSAVVRPWASRPLPQVQATFSRLNLADVWPQAPLTLLSGRVMASPQGEHGWDGDAEWVIRNALPGPVDRRQSPLQALQATVGVREGRWTVANLLAQVAGGELRGQGHWQPAGAGRAASWSADVTLKQVDMAALHTAMAALRVDGRLTATDRGEATVFEGQLQPSAGRHAVPRNLQGLALREVSAQGDWQAGRWRLGRLRVDALQAQLDAQGEISTTRPGFAGRMQGRFPGGTLAFDGHVAMPVPLSTARVLAEGLPGPGALQLQVTQAETAWAWLKGLPLGPGWWPALPDWEVQGQAELSAQWPARVTGVAEAPVTLRLSVPQAVVRAPQAGADVRPTPVRLDWWQVHATGPWSALAWQAQGTLTQAQKRVQLDTRAQVSWADGVVNVQPGALVIVPQDMPGNPAPKGEPLTLSWHQLRWDALGLHTRGAVSAFSLAWVDWLALPAVPALSGSAWGGQLRFDGDWDVHWPRDAATPVRLSAGLQRRSGDVLLSLDDGHGLQDIPAGLQEASWRVVAQTLAGQPGARLQSRLRWVSDRAGTVEAQASTDLRAAPGGWAWPEDAAVSGSLQARLPQIGVWSLLAPPGWRMRGTLAAQAYLSGTRKAPLLQGKVQADELALHSQVDGVSFVNGQLRATLAGERLVIERFALEGAGGARTGGQLQARGSAQWIAEVGAETSSRRVPRIEMQVTAERLRVSSRVDRRLVVSGQAQATLSGPQLQLRGKLTADQASITLPDELPPGLGDDVVVRGRQPTPLPVLAGQVVPDVQMELDLGRDFAVQGHGLKARLEGVLQVRGTPGQAVPRVHGEVRSSQGTYRAYGVNLNVETGVLRFAGPYDNPGLDILAIRPNITQRVGVQVSGTAQAPLVRLVAEPELPDADKLSWLVLGRAASGPGGEAAILQQAALSLLGRPGNALQDGLAGRLGLDDLSYRSGGVNADGTVSSAAVSLGKRLSSRLYVVYGQSLASSIGTVSILYEISRRLTLRAKAGEESTLEVIFTQRYD